MYIILKLLVNLEVFVYGVNSLASWNVRVLLLTYFQMLCWKLSQQKLLVGVIKAQILSIFLQILLLVHES
jgi:hypothetical protein